MLRRGDGLHSVTRLYVLSKSTSSPPLTLSHPIEGKELYLYLATSATTVSVALVRSDGESRQRPIYFVSKMLTDAETRYTDFERIVLALIMAAQKLCPYFQAHTIIVLTSYLIRAILHKQDTSGWLLKWAFELSEFDSV